MLLPPTSSRSSISYRRGVPASGGAELPRKFSRVRLSRRGTQPTTLPSGRGPEAVQDGHPSSSFRPYTPMGMRPESPRTPGAQHRRRRPARQPAGVGWLLQYWRRGRPERRHVELGNQDPTRSRSSYDDLAWESPGQSKSRTIGIHPLGPPQVAGRRGCRSVVRKSRLSGGAATTEVQGRCCASFSRNCTRECRARPRSTLALPSASPPTPGPAGRSSSSQRPNAAGNPDPRRLARARPAAVARREVSLRARTRGRRDWPVDLDLRKRVPDRFVGT
jgi:hypothetical protein